MVLEINGKVALVTGGVSGIGLEFVKELLRNGAKGVTLVDVNSNLAQTVLTEIEEEFGPNRTLFVKTDVTNLEQFENAFKRTVETFNHVDILINNAGICNDKTWQREIAINVNGVINGILLALENYLPKYKQGSQAVIVNIASVTALDVVPCMPVYSGTKAAILQMTRSWGNSHHYARTNVRVFAICPGLTATPILTNLKQLTLGEGYVDCLENDVNKYPLQEPKHVAQEGIKLIQSCPNGTVWVIEETRPPYQYVFSEREAMKK